MRAGAEFSATAGGTFENLYRFTMETGRATPSNVAVAELDSADVLTLTSFQELEHQISDFTAALDDLGLDVGDRVILEANTSAASIGMLLACCRLGLPFIPVSPGAPAKRLSSIIDTAEPALHLQGADGQREDIPHHIGTGRFSSDGLVIGRPPAVRIRHRREILPADVAYIIFTSGTTGRPKGVVMSHRAAVSFFRAAQLESIVSAEDRVGVTSPLQFDFSLAGIGMALRSGATVVPVPAELLGRPHRFMRFLRDTGVTQVQGVPSIWRTLLCDEPELLAGFDQLRRILFAGEEFPLHELRQLQRLLPKVSIMNGYGATESIACAVAEVPNPIPDDQQRLSIGFAIPGSELVIIDENGIPIECPGRAGEMYLYSPALFTAYWDDPEGTRAVLVADPLNPRSGQIVFRTGDMAYRGQNGELYFCGRGDTQVKIRGNRVELGEIERRLMEFPGVVTAAALLLPRRDGELQLCAYLGTRPGSPVPDIAVLRSFCAEALPAYMIPGKIHVLKELPLTENGKVDRARLTALSGE